MTDRMEFFIRGRARAEPFLLRGAGLPNIYLLNGYTIDEDPDYGPSVRIENVNGLYKAIGLHLVTKAKKLTGEEFRFLRKRLEFSQADLAERLMVDVQTIANYEKDKHSHGATDVALRWLYLLAVTPPEAMKEMIPEAAKQALASAKISQSARKILVGKWEEEPLPAAA